MVLARWNRWESHNTSDCLDGSYRTQKNLALGLLLSFAVVRLCIGIVDAELSLPLLENFT